MYAPRECPVSIGRTCGIKHLGWVPIVSLALDAVVNRLMLVVNVRKVLVAFQVETLGGVLQVRGGKSSRDVASTRAA